MKIYRGPSSKDFNDDTHQLVESRDLSETIQPWTVQYIFRANLTKETFAERHSEAHVMLSEQDVVAMYQALISEKLKKFDELEAENIKLKTKSNFLEAKIIQSRLVLAMSDKSDVEKITSVRAILAKEISFKR